MIECDDFDLSIDFYLIFMHLLSIADLCMNLLAIYCIIYKSNKQMGAYKWYLLIYQCTSTLFDFIYTAFSLPVIFFPVPMGYPAGIAQWIHVSTHACIIIVVIACSWLIATILNLFNYRRHLVTPIYPALSITDRGHFYTSIGIFLIYFIPCTIGILDILPDQADARKWVEEEYSCGKSAIFLPHIQIFTPWKVKRIVITAVSLAGVAFVVTVACILTSFYFLSRNRRLSQKTKQMQRKFLIYLCVQVSIPAATMFVPILALMYILGTTNRINRGLGNLALATLGAHGCVAGLTLIMCNEPYRKFMLGPIREYISLKGWAWSLRDLETLLTMCPNHHPPLALTELLLLNQTFVRLSSICMRAAPCEVIPLKAEGKTNCE